MNSFEEVFVGTPITGFCDDYFVNYEVVAKGERWAVLVNTESREPFRYILEPDDEFLIGLHEYCETTHGLILITKESS